MSPPTRRRPNGWLLRLGWLLTLWAAGVVSMGAAALALKAAMGWLGLSA